MPANFDANNYASDKAGYAERYMKIKDTELKALKWVVIPSFQVEFITQSSATASAVGGFGNKGGTREYKVSASFLHGPVCRRLQAARQIRRQTKEIFVDWEGSLCVAILRWAAA